MCQSGISVEGCYQYLDEATCMYWEGSIIEMIWDLIVQIIAQYIVANVLEFVLVELYSISLTHISAIKVAPFEKLELDKFATFVFELFSIEWLTSEPETEPFT